MAVTVRRRLIPALALLAGGLAGPASGTPWGAFGGDPGRSGHQPAGGGVAPLELLWADTGAGGRDVLTSPLVTGGPVGEQRVIFGTGDHRNADGKVVGGRVHIRTLVGGDPLTPPEGVKVSDEDDAFGDGQGSISFADTSTAERLGQVWVAYNDAAGVALAQFDEASGELVRKVEPNPADDGDKLVGVSLNSSVTMTPLGAGNVRYLFFTGFGEVNRVETLYRVTITGAETRRAEITNVTTTSGDFDLVDYASPSVVWLTTNTSNNKAHVTAGDCRGRLYTFSADDLAPGPVSAVGGENDCVLTVSAPVTPDGAAPGAPGSGLDRTLVMYVATTDPEGRSTRVHRLIQETSVTMRREPDNPPVLPGGAANALAVDAVVGPNGTLLPGGRVYVTTGRNLYVLDARYLTVVAKLVPGDDLVPGDTGFSRTTPSISGNLLFVSRDSGEQLVLDKRTLRPLPAGQFLAPASARPDAGSRAFGQPAVAGRTVVFGTGRGTFAYRARSAAAPTGYWTAAADGAVFAHGDAPFAGSRGGRPPPAPIVAVAATPSGDGYWLVSRRGDVYGFGDAPVLGSTAGGAGAGGPAGASRQAGADGQAGATGGPPVAGIATTVTGQGYWLAAADGAVSAFGDAAFLGSAAGSSLRAPVVGIAATPTGRGYWLVAADGGVFSYGDAGFFGSMGDRRLNQPVVGMAATQSGKGYWLVAADGSVFAFGAAGWFGSAGATRLAQPVVGIAAGAGGRGYTLVARDGGVFAYGDAPFLGSEAGRRLGGPIVGVALKG